MKGAPVKIFVLFTCPPDCQSVTPEKNEPRHCATYQYYTFLKTFQGNYNLQGAAGSIFKAPSFTGFYQVHLQSLQ